VEYTGADGRFAPVYPNTSGYTIYSTTDYKYDLTGALTEVSKFGEQEKVTIAYDKLGRKTSMDDPDMGAWNYSYDFNGNLASQTDARSQVINFTYDVLNRLTVKDYPAGVDTLYFYDDPNFTFTKGRLTQVLYGVPDEKSYRYDALGRMTQILQTIGSTQYPTLQSYDALSRVKSVDYPNGIKANLHLRRGRTFAKSDY